MMKYTLFFMICLTTSGLFAQKAPEEKQIQATIIRFFDGLSAFSDSTLRAEVTHDMILLEDGKVWTVDTLINHMLPMKGKGISRVNDFKFVKTTQKGNVAWLSYYNTATMSYKDKSRPIHWLETAVLIKEDKRWKITQMSSMVITGK